MVLSMKFKIYDRVKVKKHLVFPEVQNKTGIVFNIRDNYVLVKIGVMVYYFSSTNLELIKQNKSRLPEWF